MLRNFVRQRFFVVLVLLAAMLVFFTLTQERFLTPENISAVMTSSSILWVASLGLTFVMLSGGFDLSIGSMLALCGIGLGWFTNEAGLPLFVAIILTILLGVALILLPGLNDVHTPLGREGSHQRHVGLKRQGQFVIEPSGLHVRHSLIAQFLHVQLTPIL